MYVVYEPFRKYVKPVTKNKTNGAPYVRDYGMYTCKTINTYYCLLRVFLGKGNLTTG
jgi:hypothetical protein